MASTLNFAIMKPRTKLRNFESFLNGIEVQNKSEYQHSLESKFFPNLIKLLKVCQFTNCCILMDSVHSVYFLNSFETKLYHLNENTIFSKFDFIAIYCQ